MGAIFKLSALNKDKMNKLMSPIVFCVNEERVTSYTKNYNVLSINDILSKLLLEYERTERKSYVAEEFNKILDQAGESLLIKDFGILFNPEYQIDVLKLFILANRKKKIAILWCGRYAGGKLLFAEPGYIDYKSYHVSDYDIICII